MTEKLRSPTIPLMSKMERSPGRKLLEKTLSIGGATAIVIGISEDYKPVALGGVAALVSWGSLKVKDQKSRGAEQSFQIGKASEEENNDNSADETDQEPANNDANDTGSENGDYDNGDGRW